MGAVAIADYGDGERGARYGNCAAQSNHAASGQGSSSDLEDF